MIKSRLVSLLAVLFAGITCVYCVTITVPNGETDGRWGSTVYCPIGSIANGLATQNDKGAINLDKTGLNGIELHCSDAPQTVVNITGDEGDWNTPSFCVEGSYFVAFQLRVLPNTPAGANSTQDNTAVNDIKMRCSNDREVSVNGNNEGDWGEWSLDCATGICGVQTRYNPLLPGIDNTAVNSIRFECC